MLWGAGLVAAPLAWQAVGSLAAARFVTGHQSGDAAPSGSTGQQVAVHGLATVLDRPGGRVVPTSCTRDQLS